MPVCPVVWPQSAWLRAQPTAPAPPQSLYYRGLREPADVLQHCLTLFRRARVPELLPFLTPQPGGSQPVVGGQPVQEEGPLAPLAGGCIF